MNVDESELQTVQKKPQWVIGGIGKKQVVPLTSSGRGVNVSMVVCANASVQLIVPVIIFKRMQMNEQLKGVTLSRGIVSV